MNLTVKKKTLHCHEERERERERERKDLRISPVK